MRDKILAYIRRHHMVEKGDLVCVGLSGGADSVCLLVILQELAEELGIRLRAVHVNHGLRGEESDADQAFTERLCREREIPLFVYARKVGELAAQLGLGTEETGRLVRRQIYDQCLEEGKATKIALAHHQNDLAETLLFHLARGSSLTGLGAIRPVRDCIIRPLLCLSRQEVEEELNKRGMTWRTDSTNLQDQYTRNCIRHHLIPCMEQEVNPEAVRHMAQAAADLAGADDFLREEARRRMPDLVEEREGELLISEDFRGLPDILQGYLLMECLQRLAGGRKDLTRLHIGMLKDLADRQTGKHINLPGGIVGMREYQGIRLGREAIFRGKTSPETRSIGQGQPPVPETGRATNGQSSTSLAELVELQSDRLLRGSEAEFPLGEGRLVCRILEGDGWKREENSHFPTGEKIPEKKYTKWLDYDRMKDGLVIRTRRAGDYLVVNSSGGRKKLKDYLIDRKIPQRERDQVLLLASGSEIYWVVGHRISENCKVDGDTRRVLYIEIRGGQYHE